jgi:hypothetical protein
MAKPADFRPRAQLAHLVAYGVDFVVVGGIAATIYGSARNTSDLDICPATDASNLETLGRALIDIEARLRDVDEDVPFVPDGRTLARMEILTLDTSMGRLDVLVRRAGSPPYSQLRRRAQRVDIGTTSVLVASIEDLIAMKEAAGRPKDLVVVEELEAIRRLRRRLSVKE